LEEVVKGGHQRKKMANPLKEDRASNWGQGGKLSEHTMGRIRCRKDSYGNVFLESKALGGKKGRLVYTPTWEWEDGIFVHKKRNYRGEKTSFHKIDKLRFSE